MRIGVQVRATRRLFGFVEGRLTHYWINESHQVVRWLPPATGRIGLKASVTPLLLTAGIGFAL